MRRITASTFCLKSSAPMKRPTSIAPKMCPVRAGPLTSTMVLTSPVRQEPVRTPHRRSTMSDRPDPLAPPIGSRLPLSAVCASVVGSPAASVAHPSGISLPVSAAKRILPRATNDVDMSSTIGFSVPAGTATAIGLVPSSGVIVPKGFMAGEALVSTTPIMPASSAVMA